MNHHLLALDDSRSSTRVARTICIAQVSAARSRRVRRCPACSGVIYSRRFSTCRDCGAALPTALHGPSRARS